MHTLNPPRTTGQLEATRVDVMYDIQEYGKDGLIGAVWYGAYELIVEYVTSHRRDTAVQTIREGSSDTSSINVLPIGPGGHKSYATWTLPWYKEDSPAALTKALHDHFEGTGYSSFYTYGRIDVSRGLLRIIFHHAPPNLAWTLEGAVGFRERKFRQEVVSADDYPLRKVTEEYDSNNLALTPSSRNPVSAIAVHPINGENTLSQEASATGQPSEKTGKDSSKKGKSFKQDSSRAVNNDQSTEDKATMTVALYGMQYRVLSNTALPLHLATFNMFATACANLHTQEPRCENPHRAVSGFPRNALP